MAPLFLIPLVHAAICSAFHSPTYSESILPDGVYHTQETLAWFDCIQACSNDLKCGSYNFGGNVCQFNECGLGLDCRGRSALLYSPGYVFQQLRETKNSTNDDAFCRRESHGFPPTVATTTSPAVSTSSPGPVVATFTTWGTMLLFVEGKLIRKVVSRGNVTAVTLPRDVKVLVISAFRDVSAIPGFIGSFDNGVVTDRMWKCFKGPLSSPGWAASNFNDSHWPQAVEYDNSGITPRGISHSAQWIWVEDWRASNIYCRGTIARS